MKKHSVLARRAWLFTAIVLFTAIAVGLLVFRLSSRYFASQTARTRVLNEARVMAQAASQADDAALNGAVQTAQVFGVSAVLCAPEALTGVPQAAVEAAALAAHGQDSVGDDGTTAWAVVAVRNAETPVLAATMPVSGSEKAAMSAAFGAVAGVLIALGVGWLLIGKVLGGVSRPLEALRDVAVAVGEGDMGQRADETAPGELGELGRAFNKVSTELSRNMYQLILERNRLKHMLDGLSEGIVAVDSQGRITHTNPALTRMFKRRGAGTHLEDLRMRTIDDATVWEDFDNVVKTGQPITRSMDVREMNLRLTITPIFDELGTIVGAVGLFSDVTQMERLERTRREYVSNVSHELRTPLTAMRALVEPLKEGMVTSEADRMRYYDIILREVMRLSRLINDQLELSRLQSGTLAIEKSRVAVDDLVYDTCERFRVIAEDKGLKLEIPTDFSACPAVWTNADRAEQLLIILLDNAIKYTEKGGVSVSGRWDDKRVVLTVKDTGIGIDEQDLPYVFDRFYKADKAHSGKGSGLGLSIAREVLKLMNEDIWVTSKKGEGTSFSFTMAVYKSGAHAA